MAKPHTHLKHCLAKKIMNYIYLLTARGPRVFVQFFTIEKKTIITTILCQHMWPGISKKRFTLRFASKQNNLIEAKRKIGSKKIRKEAKK
jgi:hypothetical protein